MNQSAAESRSREKRQLDDVMLAMDVVDTLRHREHLVERELHAEDRDEQLLQRLREIYTSQGMEVPDHVLKEGVAALREQRFAYKPPNDSLSVKLAHLYIERGRWFKRLSAIVATFIVAWGSYTFLVTAPSERDRVNRASEINRDIRTADEQIEALEKRRQQLQGRAETVTRNVPDDLQNAASARQSAIRSSLDKAGTLLTSARELSQPADLDGSNVEQRAEQAAGRLARQQAQIRLAESELDAVDRSLEQVGSLGQLPDELAAVRDAALKASRQQAASAQARELYDLGISALGAGDIEQAMTSLDELRALRARLDQSYTLRIVSRPGERSGVWRIPDRNPDARNYYIIVEAIGSDGRVLKQDITSEEDGSTRTVDKWGMRVERQVYEAIAADKQDDGIIQQRQFGKKRRGYLQDEYQVKTPGGMITDW